MTWRGWQRNKLFSILFFLMEELKGMMEMVSSRFEINQGNYSSNCRTPCCRMLYTKLHGFKRWLKNSWNGEHGPVLLESHWTRNCWRLWKLVGLTACLSCSLHYCKHQCLIPGGHVPGSVLLLQGLLLKIRESKLLAQPEWRLCENYLTSCASWRTENKPPIFLGHGCWNRNNWKGF